MKDKLLQALVTLSENEMLERAFHTFWQTALVVWALSDFSLDYAVIAGAGGAGLSAAKTVFKEALSKYRS